MTTALGQYRLDLINHTKAELAKPQDQQDEHRKLFAASITYRLEGVIGDMLETPQSTADYATALNALVDAYTKLKPMIKG